VRAALAGSALLTLTGTGGCGKTRLALRVAEDPPTDRGRAGIDGAPMHAARRHRLELRAPRGGRAARLPRLSVFVGVCALEAATVVCGDGRDDLETLDLLARLADKSLVRVEDQGGVTRYGMLERIRQYAIEECDRQNETAPLRDRHLRFHLELAESVAPHLDSYANEDPRPWLEWLRPVRDDLLAALY
jgi:predicted ATPase